MRYWIGALVLPLLSASAFAQTKEVRTAPPVQSGDGLRPKVAIAGDYRGDKGAKIQIRHIDRQFYLLVCEQQWEGIGVLDGVRYIGVYRLTNRAATDTSAATGRHTIDFADPGQPRVVTSRATGERPTSTEIWSRIPTGENPPPRVNDTPPPTVVRDPDHPPFGESIFVEELPEAITRTAPVMPDCAREQKISGTVVIQALVGRDGSVTDTKIVNSDSVCLNDAAVAAVRQWKFKPALAKGQPVAVWVAVPVRFRIN